MATVLTRDQIRAVDDRIIEQVMLPQWGEDSCLYVLGLSGKQRDLFEEQMIISKRDKKGRSTSELNLKNLRARLIVLTAVDSDNPDICKPVFTAADESWLGDKNSVPLQALYSTAQRLSGLSNEDVDSLTEDLGNDQSDGSGSGLPDTSDTDPSQTLKLV